MNIICFINQKGGVGKSTSTVNVGVHMAKMGLRTLIIDLDPQAHSSLLLSEQHLFIEDIFKDMNFNINDIIGNTYIKNEVSEKNLIANLYIAPSSLNLAFASEGVIGHIHRHKILSRQLKKVNDMDLVIIDCPPTLGILSQNAIHAADFFIVPIEYSRYALDGMEDLFRTIKDIKDSENIKFKILRNKYDSRNKQTNEYVDSELESYSGFLLKTVIRKTEAINQAQIAGYSILDYEPQSNGCVDYTNLGNEIMEILNEQKISTI